MFESISVRQPPTLKKGIDVGALAEVLLFYGRVRLVLSYGTVAELLRSLGEDNLRFLIENEFVQLTYSMSANGVRTDSVSGIKTHNFIEYQLLGDKPNAISAEAQIKLAYTRALGAGPSAQKFSRYLCDKSTAMVGMEHLLGTDKSLAREAERTLLRPGFSNALASVVLHELVPEYMPPHPLKFELIKMRDGLLVDTNIDLEGANSYYHKHVPKEHSSITYAYILDHFWSSYIDSALSAKSGSDMLANRVLSAVTGLHIKDVISRTRKSEIQIKAFSDFVFEESRCLREVINSGERSFDEFRDILVRSKRFKEWLVNQDPNGELVKQYHAACVADTWVDKLPAKATRFALFSAAGLGLDMLVPTGLGTAAGVGLGALDTFVVDKLTSGWRPNQFVQGTLSRFVTGDKP